MKKIRIKNKEKRKTQEKRIKLFVNLLKVSNQINSLSIIFISKLKVHITKFVNFSIISKSKLITYHKKHI